MINKFIRILLIIGIMTPCNQFVQAFSDLDKDLKLTIFDFLTPIELANVSACSKNTHQLAQTNKRSRSDYLFINDDDYVPIEYLYSSKSLLNNLYVEKKLDLIEEVCKYFCEKYPRQVQDYTFYFKKIFVEIYYLTNKIAHDLCYQYFRNQVIISTLGPSNFHFSNMNEVLRQEFDANRIKLKRIINSIKLESKILKRLNKFEYRWTQPIEYLFMHKDSEQYFKSKVEREIHTRLKGNKNIWIHIPALYTFTQDLILNEVLVYSFQHLTKDYQGPLTKKGVLERVLGCFFFKF